MIVISTEGLDKSGKYSLVKQMKEQLEADGYKVAASEFHRYDTPTGELIQKWLHGEYTASQQTIELIMAADKYAQVQYFEKLESEGYDILLLDRYIGSQYVYSEAAGIDPDWTDTLLSYLRPPDMEIYIDVSPEVSMARKGKHGDNDRYESDYQLLDRARRLYLGHRPYHAFPEFPQNNTKFVIVNGEGTPDETFTEAYKHVQRFLVK